MSFDLADLDRDEREVTVLFLGREINFTYRPAVTTGAWDDKVATAANTSDSVEFILGLAEALVEWDVHRGDEHISLALPADVSDMTLDKNLFELEPKDVRKLKDAEKHHLLELQFKYNRLKKVPSAALGKMFGGIQADLTGDDEEDEDRKNGLSTRSSRGARWAR